MELPLTVVDDTHRRDVFVVCDEGVRVGDVVAALGSPGAALFNGTRKVEPGTAMGDSGLVAGQEIGIGQPTAASAPAATGALALEVSGGLYSGAVFGLRDGTFTIGRQEGCDLRLRDTEVSRLHAQVTVAGGQVMIEDLHSSNGTLVNGARIEEPSSLLAGDLIEVGGSIVTLTTDVGAPAELHRERDGTVRFNKPPRKVLPVSKPTFEVPEEPTKPTARRFSVLAMLAPVVLGVFIAFVANSLYFLLFSLASPVMLAANAWSDRRGGRKEYEAHRRTYEKDVAALRGRIAEALREQERELRAAYPDPATIATTATRPTQRLWERRRRDADFLVVRVGLGDHDADVALTGRTAASWPQSVAHQVPITVAMRDASVVGVAGPRELALPFARSLVLQLVTLHAPSDLGVVFACAGPTDGWDWIKWLPHLEGRKGQSQASRNIGVTDEQRRRRLDALKDLVERRAAERGRSVGGTDHAWPFVLLVLDDVTTLRTDPTVAYLLREGPSVGLLALCLARDHAGLPAEATVTVELVAPDVGPAVLTLRAADGEVTGVLPDGVSEEHAAAVARALAPRFEVESAAADAEAVLPDPPLDQFAVLGISHPSVDDVLSRWQRPTSARDLRGRIGALAESTFELNLPSDGPHALIAGTTGSGKSELLQTLVASLALETPPSALNFLLVDFKGRSAFRDCERLPHTLGVISNLDGRLVERALDSIQAELRWRQRRFDEVNARDYDDYAKHTGEGRPPMPRLVVIVDELKEVADAYGETVTRLNQAARLGRSLGVHLILATQKPASVSGLADLRGNTDLKLCLRVQDEADSRDLVGVPDAATIPREKVGRGIVRMSDGRRVAFQTGYLGGPPPATVASGEGLSVRPFDLESAGNEAPRHTAVHPVASADGNPSSTELEMLVEAMRQADAQAPSPPPRMPWLPPLPAQLVWDDPRLVAARAAGGPSFALGLVDVPREQRQDPLVVNFDEVGHVLIIGPPRSGRTTTLRSLAGVVARQSPPTDVHLYVLDFRRRGLVDLERLPHCGAVIGADEPDRLERFFGFLEAEIERRAAAMQGAASLAEQRSRAATGDALPYVVVLCDDYDAFSERFAFEDGGRLVDRFHAILSNGVGYGIHFVVTGDRRMTPTRLGSGIEARLFLRPVDRDDQLSLGLTASLDPEMPSGRGYWYRGPAEAQVCLLDPSPAGEAQVAAIERLAARPAGAVDSRALPLPIRPLPSRITLAELSGLRDPAAPQSRGAVPLGVGGIAGGVVDVDLVANGSLFAAVGPRGSGRSTTLLTVLSGLAAGDNPPFVVALAPRRSPLRSMQRPDNSMVVLTDIDSMGTGLADALAREGPIAVVIDDAEMVVDSSASTRLDRIVRAAPDNNWVVLMAGTTGDLARRFSGWSFDVRQGRTGVILQPTSSADGELLDVRLPRSVGTGRQPPPGRGILAVRGDWTMIHVAMP